MRNSRNTASRRPLGVLVVMQYGASPLLNLLLTPFAWIRTSMFVGHAPMTQGVLLTSKMPAVVNQDGPRFFFYIHISCPRFSDILTKKKKILLVWQISFFTRIIQYAINNMFNVISMYKIELVTHLSLCFLLDAACTLKLNGNSNYYSSNILYKIIPTTPCKVTHLITPLCIIPSYLKHDAKSAEGK